MADSTTTDSRDMVPDDTYLDGYDDGNIVVWRIPRDKVGEHCYINFRSDGTMRTFTIRAEKRETLCGSRGLLHVAITDHEPSPESLSRLSWSPICKTSAPVVVPAGMFITYRWEEPATMVCSK